MLSFSVRPRALLSRAPTRAGAGGGAALPHQVLEVLRLHPQLSAKIQATIQRADTTDDQKVPEGIRLYTQFYTSQCYGSITLRFGIAFEVSTLELWGVVGGVVLCAIILYLGKIIWRSETVFQGLPSWNYGEWGVGRVLLFFCDWRLPVFLRDCVALLMYFSKHNFAYPKS